MSYIKERFGMIPMKKYGDVEAPTFNEVQAPTPDLTPVPTPEPTPQPASPPVQVPTQIPIEPTPDSTFYFRKRYQPQFNLYREQVPIIIERPIIDTPIVKEETNIWQSICCCILILLFIYFAFLRQSNTIYVVR